MLEGVCHFGFGKSAEAEALRENVAADSVHPAPIRAPHRSAGASGEFTGWWIVGVQYQDFSKTAGS